MPADGARSIAPPETSMIRAEQCFALRPNGVLQRSHNVPNLTGYPTKLIARLLYGCGLRVALRLDFISQTAAVKLEASALELI